METAHDMTWLERELVPPSWSGLDIAHRVAGPEDKVHRRLREAVSVPVRRHLWVPEDAVEFTPALSDVVYGDGRALLAITTIHDRPRYWLVRIDSSWPLWLDPGLPGGDDEEMADYCEHITENLRLEFGDGEPRWDEDEWEDEEDPVAREYGLPYPSIDLRDGYSWRRESWPEAGFDGVPHPYDPHIRILPETQPAVEPGP